MTFMTERFGLVSANSVLMEREYPFFNNTLNPKKKTKSGLFIVQSKSDTDSDLAGTLELLQPYMKRKNIFASRPTILDFVRQFPY